MPQWIQDLADGWPMIAAHPKTFMAILIAIIVVVWVVISWSYSSVLASKNSQIELQDRQLSDFREKLKGATPEQAKDKIDSLEGTLRKMIGNNWEPLRRPQIANLAIKLKEIKKSRAQIMYENPRGKELAQSILDAFKEAGWDEAWMSQGSGLGDGIVVGWSSRAVAVKEALEATAKLPVWAKDTEKEIPDLVIVGVGLNPY